MAKRGRWDRWVLSAERRLFMYSGPMRNYTRLPSLGPHEEPQHEFRSIIGCEKPWFPEMVRAPLKRNVCCRLPIFGYHEG